MTIKNAEENGNSSALVRH